MLDGYIEDLRMLYKADKTSKVLQKGLIKVPYFFIKENKMRLGMIFKRPKKRIDKKKYYKGKPVLSEYYKLHTGKSKRK